MWIIIKALCFHGKALSAMEAVVEVLFTCIQLVNADYRYLKRSSRTSRIRPLKLDHDAVMIKFNYSIRGKYPEKRTCSST